MNIKQNEISDAIKYLQSFYFDNKTDMCLFFPIETGTSESGITITKKIAPVYSTVVPTNLTPGIICEYNKSSVNHKKSEKNSISLGYVNASLLVPFDFKECANIFNFNIKLKENKKEKLFNYTAYLIDKKGILVAFDY